MLSTEKKLQKTTWWLCLPGGGKSEAVTRLRAQGLYCIDGDHLSDVLPPKIGVNEDGQKTYPSGREERIVDLIRMLAPDHVFWSRWPNDFPFSIGELGRVEVTHIPRDWWLSSIATNRPDLPETFSDAVLRKWHDHYRHVEGKVQAVSHIVSSYTLADGEFLSDHPRIQKLLDSENTVNGPTPDSVGAKDNDIKPEGI